MLPDTALPRTDRQAVAKAAALWLLFLGPFFYLTYGASNWLASIRTDVPDIAFAWERHVPFIAWTIVPYWSINLLYALSLFLNSSVEGVGRLARRYLTVQIIAVTCFLAFPLQAIFVRPGTTGLPGFMFDVLGGFDKPFNQAPSLHIALLLVIWDHWRGRLTRAWRPVWHIWSLLIGVSVLTTWQHHVMDIPTGLLSGLFALWLFPQHEHSPLAGFRLTGDRRAVRLAVGYGSAGLAFVLLAVFSVSWSPLALLWLWPALAVVIVALGYVGAGEKVFQKRDDGRISLASDWLLMPYRLGACINIRLWTRKLPASVEIADGVCLGRFPRRSELVRFTGVVDIAAEMKRPRRINMAWRAVPVLDLMPVSPRKLAQAVVAIEDMRREGPVLVCCALGFQRSASVVAAWLVKSGREADVEAAVNRIHLAGRRVHLPPETVTAIEKALK